MKLLHTVLFLAVALYAQAAPVKMIVSHSQLLIHQPQLQQPLATTRAVSGDSISPLESTPDNEKGNVDKQASYATISRRGFPRLLGDIIKNDVLSTVERTPLMDEILATSRYGSSNPPPYERFELLRSQLPRAGARIREPRGVNPWLVTNKAKKPRDEGKFLKLSELFRLKRMLQRAKDTGKLSKLSDNASVGTSSSSFHQRAPAQVLDKELPVWGAKKLRTPVQQAQPALALPEWGLRKPRTQVEQPQLVYSDSPYSRTSRSPSYSSSSAMSTSSSDPPPVDQRRLPARRSTFAPSGIAPSDFNRH